jgi:hypothetical protein
MKKFFAIFAAVCLLAAANVFAANTPVNGTETVSCTVVPAITVTGDASSIQLALADIGVGDTYDISDQSKFIDFLVTGGVGMTYNIAMSGPTISGPGTAPTLTLTSRVGNSTAPAGTTFQNGSSSSAWSNAGSFEVAPSTNNWFQLTWDITKVDATSATAGAYTYQYDVNVNYVY